MRDIADEVFGLSLSLSVPIPPGPDAERISELINRARSIMVNNGAVPLKAMSWNYTWGEIVAESYLGRESN